MHLTASIFEIFLDPTERAMPVAFIFNVKSKVMNCSCIKIFFIPLKKTKKLWLSMLTFIFFSSFKAMCLKINQPN